MPRHQLDVMVNLAIRTNPHRTVGSAAISAVPAFIKEENSSMLRSATIAASVVLALTVSPGAIAQTYYDDQACRQYADAQVASLRGQASGQAVGSTLLGAGLGAAIGGAVGSGRGAGIGAASGALAGTGVGAANAQNAAANLQQQYNEYYSQCLASRSPQRPGYAAPAPAYGAAPGYGAQPGYGYGA
jgi:uncharacterized protein YcfJ